MAKRTLIPEYEWIDVHGQKDEYMETYRLTFDCFPNDLSEIEEFITQYGSIYQTEIRKEKK